MLFLGVCFITLGASHQVSVAQPLSHEVGGYLPHSGLGL